jgi:hypothetical protein
MVQAIERFDGLAEIILVDNGSRYKPLREYYYRAQPHSVIYLDNVGHTAPWTEPVRASVRTDLYVVTDTRS